MGNAEQAHGEQRLTRPEFNDYAALERFGADWWSWIGKIRT